MTIGRQSFIVQLVSALDTAADYWAKLVQGKRETWFFVFISSSSLVAFLPFARDVGVSSFLMYALLPMILVFANRARLCEVPLPSGIGLSFSAAAVVGSFAFNYLFGVFTGNGVYGLTDYVILVVGVFSAFYSIQCAFVQTGVLLLLLLRGATLSLSILYSSIFVSVSDFFVSIVVFMSRILVSPDIAAGMWPGEILVGGEAGASSVFIGWACAGLEELALISVILCTLIISFELSRVSALTWFALGVIGSFVVNVLRMVTLVWVAYAHGMEDMLWVHTHLGDALFLAWIAAFWYAFFRFSGGSVQTSTNP